MAGRLERMAGGRSMLISLIVALAYFMENLDATIIVTALPDMAKSFVVDPTRMSLGVTAYVMAAAAGMTASGWLADRLGTRTLFCWAIALFTASSMACGLAPDFTSFIIARAVQGAAAAMMSPVGRLVVLRNSAKSELLRALSTLVWPGLIAPVLGPPLGGLITDQLSWRWIFYVNLPVGLIGLWLVYAFVPEEKNEPIPFDLQGFVLTAVALCALTYGLDLVGMQHDAGVIGGLALMAGAVAIGALAIRHMRRAAHPLLPLDTLRHRTFWVSSITGGTIARVAISAVPFLLPLMFQLVYRLDPLESGALLIVYAGANLALKTVTNRIMKAFGIRRVLIWNAVLTAVAISLCAFIVPHGFWIANGLILMAAGATRSMQLTALAMVTFADIGPAQRQPASVLSSLTQQIGMGAGVALGALLLAVSQSSRGAPMLGIEDFRVALIVAGALNLVALWSFVSLAKDAGDEISGYRAAPAG